MVFVERGSEIKVAEQETHMAMFNQLMKVQKLFSGGTALKTALQELEILGQK